MKQLLKRGLLLAVLVVGTILPLSAQSVQAVVTMRDGTEQLYYLSNYDRMYFEENEVLVIGQESVKELVKIPLADIRKINCYELENTVEELFQTVTVYPNPVYETLTLRNLSGTQVINIYALDGRMVKSVEVTGDQPIDISDLSSGYYLVKTPTSTHKMIKL